MSQQPPLVNYQRSPLCKSFAMPYHNTRICGQYKASLSRWNPARWIPPVSWLDLVSKAATSTTLALPDNWCLYLQSPWLAMSVICSILTCDALSQLQTWSLKRPMALTWPGWRWSSSRPCSSKYLKQTESGKRHQQQ